MSQPRRVLLAGATGAVGREILRLLKEEGVFVRTLSRAPSRAKALEDIADEVRVADATRPETLTGLCDGVDAVISALGASVGLKLQGRQPYTKIDKEGNLNLLEEARRAGVKRFAYIAAETGPGFAHTAYIQAHEAVVSALKASEMTWIILRPTGIFTAFDDFLKFAKWGMLPLLGDGSCQTNPIHPTDVAEACVSSLWGESTEMALGGPEVMSRREIAAKAAEAIGKRPRFVRSPIFLLRFYSWVAKLIHPRLSQLIPFVIAVSTHDAIAPKVGTRTLDDYYKQLHQRKSLAS